MLIQNQLVSATNQLILFITLSFSHNLCYFEAR